MRHELRSRKRSAGTLGVIGSRGLRTICNDMLENDEWQRRINHDLVKLCGVPSIQRHLECKNPANISLVKEIERYPMCRRTQWTRCAEHKSKDLECDIRRSQG